MADAGVLYETDAYRERPAPTALRGAVTCLWTRRGDGAPVQVLPDGCSDLVWRPGAGAVVAGPDTRSMLSPTHPGEWIVGVRLAPGAGAAYGVPLHELRDQRVPLADLGLVGGERLHGGHAAGDPLPALTALAARLLLATPPDDAVRAAAARLADPRQRVESLAAELGFSERQLRRRFAAAVGYGPKVLQRVLRLQRFLARPELDLARAAADAGYVDQAHLTHDCRRLTGLTPTELRRGRQPRRSIRFSPDASANPNVAITAAPTMNARCACA